MKYRRLGASDLMISEISLGSWLTYGLGVESDQARACVEKAFEVGINFFDTANVYGKGSAERFLGEVLSGRPRDSYILATKVYFPMDEENRGLSRAQIAKQVDASLKRLKVDYVDLYQCHRYDDEVPLEETMEALSEVVRQGKARYIGFSEWSAKNIEDAFAIEGVERFVSSQPQYSLLWRAPESEVIPTCKAHHISQVVWSPLAEGVLTGKYGVDTPPPPDSRASHELMSKLIGRWLQADVLIAVDQLKALAAEAGCSLAQFALAWVLREPNVASAIAGASRPQQVTENAAACELVIDPALFAKAEAILASVKRA